MKKFGERHLIHRGEGLGYDAGYYLHRCECGKGLYISEDELYSILHKGNLRLNLKKIIWDRAIRRLRIPKLSFILEWRRLEELQKIPRARKEQMLALRRSGLTLEQVGKKYGLSRQRVCQIVNDKNTKSYPQARYTSKLSHT